MSNRFCGCTRSFARNTGAIAGVVVGVAIILIIAIIILIWHRSMMKAYSRMEAAQAGPGTVRSAAAAGDLESQKNASIETKDAADAGEKKGFRLWRWT